MNSWVAAAWGLTGGLCVEALTLYSHIRATQRWNWRRPIPQGLAAFLISICIRAGAGAGLAAAAAGSGQVSGSLAAFGLGVAAPLVVAKLAQTVPLVGSEIAVAQNRDGLTSAPHDPADSLVGGPQKNDSVRLIDSVDEHKGQADDAS
jgi:hypothetical protein